MNRTAAWAALAAMAAAVLAAFFAPWPVAIALLAAGLAGISRGRGMFALFAASTVAIDAGILAVAERSWGGAIAGALGGVRLVAALAANLALAQRIGAARILDGLRLPPRATMLVAAVLLAARDAARDLDRLRDARRSEGAWPRGRIARAREAARLFPALFVLAEERARARRDAVTLAGFATPAWFVPLVATSALAAAGRMALLALPNVAFTYVVVFLGGLLYGPWVGVGAALLSMTLTDLLLSGLYPLSFVNAPAMALLALAGAALRRFDFIGGSRADRAAGTIFAFAAGALGTFAFSVASDTLTWLAIAPGVRAAWTTIVLAGLAFNVVPAGLNGAIFALAVRPVLAAQRARQAGRAPAPTRPAHRDASPPSAPLRTETARSPAESASSR